MPPVFPLVCSMTGESVSAATYSMATARSRAVAMEYVAAETDSPVIEQTKGKTGGIGSAETAAVVKDGGVIDQRHGGPDPGAHSPGTVPNRQHTARAANHRGIEAVKLKAARCPSGALG